MDQYRIIQDARSAWFGEGGYIVQRLIFGQWQNVGWHKTQEDAQAVIDGNIECQRRWAERFENQHA